MLGNELNHLKQITIFCLLSLLILAPVGAQDGSSADSREFCSWIDQSLNGEIAEWIGYPEGWRDYPDDLVTVDFFWLDDPQELKRADNWRDHARVYVLLYSPSQNALWLFIYRSLKQWTDAEGNHMGTHDFCAVRVYRLGER